MSLFNGDESDDAVATIIKADAAIEQMIAENEPAVRAMLAQSLERSLAGRVPLNRQNRRADLIDAALDPVSRQFTRPSFAKLKQCLALLMATEAKIVFKDVLQLDNEEAREARLWAIRAMVSAARRPD